MFGFISTFFAVLLALMVYQALVLGISLSPKIQTVLAKKYMKIMEKIEEKIGEKEY